MSGTGYRVDVRRMDAFSAAELHALLKLRVDVFVVEQKCPYNEIDGKDPDALHLRLMEGDALIAAARLFAPAGPSKPSRIGRVVVSPDHRGKRLGEALMREAIGQCESLFPEHPIALSAQSHLERFYRSFGFTPVSEEYLEDDIPHVDMMRQMAGVPAP
ncbi:GNAT family N-acetyltransferase [Pseudomonas sp. R2.Fl]|nr:GNAT family N-acetyltransferase [Pseudomonas sp. R2.Fl]